MSILKIKDSQGNWVGVPTVKGDTGNGISSAILNDDYTLTLTFTDGTTYTTPSIRGEKGQTGDTPTITASKTGKTTSIYVDGSEVAQVEDGTDGTDGISPTVTITPITGGHRITITDADGEHSADVMDGDDYTLTAQDKQDIADIAEADLTPTILNAFPTDIASGSIASFTDGADNLPLKSLIVDINPIQDLSNGDPSPENICPISGWTGIEIRHTGKNLFDETKVTFGRWADADGKESQNISGCISDYIFIPTQKNILAMYHGVRPYSASIIEYDVNRGFVKRTHQAFIDNQTPIVVTPNINTKFIRAQVYAPVLGKALSAQILASEKFQLEFGTVATDYEPYAGQTIPISWQTEAGTVYDGSLDVLTGKLTVYPYYASYNGETLTGRWISDRDVYAVGTTPTIGAQVVNIGAEGTEYQLTPHEVNSLLGANNIFADTGDTACEYRADTKLYIERLTAPDSADMIADANITSGQYFMVGNSLYKATANIANGGQIIVGTNCIRKSLSEALNEINA